MGLLDPPSLRRADLTSLGVIPASAPLVVPLAPTAVVAQAGVTQAAVSWTPPQAGYPLTSYVVTASPGGATATVAWPATTATVTGLTNGTAYTFTVKAVNSVGQSPASTASAAVTPSPDPGGLGIQGCVAWWAADKLTGFSNGASVATWPDASGNGFTAIQPVPPITQSAPTYLASWTNSKPALTFDGSTMSLVTTLTTDKIGSRMTMFVACEVTTFAGAKRLISDQTSVSDSAGFLVDTNASTWRAIFGGGATTAPAATISTPTVLTITAPGFEYVSGTKASGYVTAATKKTSPVFIASAAASANFPGRIAEVIFYGRTLSDSERHQVEGYLGTKYAITMAVQ